MPDSKYIRVIIHSLLWILYAVIFIYFFNPLQHGDDHLTHKLLAITAQVTAFYFVTNTLFNRYLKQSHYLLFTLISLASLFYITTVTKMIIMLLSDINITVSQLFTSELWSTFLISMLLVTSGVTVKIISAKERLVAINRQIQIENRRVESLALNNQIGTHFMFNTLNNIYGMAITGSPDTASSILLLSELLEIILYKARDKTYNLEYEVKLITNYIKLQEVRLEEKPSIDFKVTGEIKRCFIAPMIVFTLVENAFKHFGETKEGQSWMKIEIEAGVSELYAKVENSISPENNTARMVSIGGIGVENLSRRMNLIYPGTHSYRYGVTGESYNSTITLMTNI